MAKQQELTREAIGKALHKHNKKRFAWPPISKDESMGYEALTKDTRAVEGWEGDTTHQDIEDVDLEIKETA